MRLGIVLMIDAAITVGMAAVLGLGCAWIIAHDPPAKVPYDGDTWEPPNTQQGFCGAALGCGATIGPMGIEMRTKDGGVDASQRD